MTSLQRLREANNNAFQNHEMPTLVPFQITGTLKWAKSFQCLRVWSKRNLTRFLQVWTCRKHRHINRAQFGPFCHSASRHHTGNNSTNSNISDYTEVQSQFLRSHRLQLNQLQHLRLHRGPVPVPEVKKSHSQGQEVRDPRSSKSPTQFQVPRSSRIQGQVPDPRSRRLRSILEPR